eukprot:bmy_16109T0
MVMAAKKGPGPGGGVGGGKAEAEAASEVWCRRVRELGGCSQAGNRHCFECAQRGVTYVDITVGSFVCTTCSGLLRGLNPPHRVKSISMTTFTEPEVVFLQSRGNEVCRKIWLGLFDARTSLIPDSRDPQKVKEFLQEKYEKKRWYVPPDQVKGPTYTKGGASTPVQGSIPEGKPPRTLLGDPVPSLSAAASTSSQVTLRCALQLILGFGRQGYQFPKSNPLNLADDGPRGVSTFSALLFPCLASLTLDLYVLEERPQQEVVFREVRVSTSNVTIPPRKNRGQDTASGACWPTSAETPLLLPRWHQLLLHSQPLGVSETWEENLPTTYVPITQGIHSALALCTGMNVMVILKYHGWEGGGQMSTATITAGISFGSLTRKHGSWGLPALPLRALERAFFLVSLSVKMGQGDCHRFHFPCPLPEDQQ